MEGARKLRAPQAADYLGLSTSTLAKMRLRGDAFNALNTPVLQGPNTSATGSTFGTVSGQEPPRSFQFSLNLQY